MRITPLLAVLFSALCGALPAQVLNIDFNSPDEPYAFAGLAAVPDAAGETAVWNQITGGSSISASGLVDSYGNVTSIGIELVGIGGFVDLEGDQELGGAARNYDRLMSDYVFLSAPVNTEVLTKAGSIYGLTADKTYDIYFYSQGNKFMGTYSVGQNGLFSIGGEARQSSWDGVQGGDGMLAEGIEYVKYTVEADAGGRIDFTWANVVTGPAGNVVVDLDGSNSRFAVINGIQIVDVAAAVPEPATALLGCLGLMALMFRRRV